MRFSAQFLGELHARVPVSDVVGTRVKRRKADTSAQGPSTRSGTLLLIHNRAAVPFAVLPFRCNNLDSA